MKILLITPPFTQLNTPYPATAQLKGFLKLHGHEVFQADLGIELINRIFSAEGLRQVFDGARARDRKLSPNGLRIVRNGRHYLQTIGPVMDFLQGRDLTLSQLICREDLLPRAGRFDQLPDLEWCFGNSGLNDRARLLATLYIEDLGDLIAEAVTLWFGFSRYAEKLGLSAHSFAPIDAALRAEENLLDGWLRELFMAHLFRLRPDVVGITVPFPGNLYGALKCGQIVKQSFPGVAIVLGGGYVSTELRGLAEPKVFDYADFVTLDDGELPLLNILKHLDGERGEDGLTRTFLRSAGAVRYVDSGGKDPSFAETGWPDYADLPPDRYLSLIEIANPMHRLWSDGRWNKLTIAHGCYWHKCSFCDTTLDYIRRFEAVPASMLADRIERVMAQTGQSGFHFVDEAAPPAALKELALELLRRKVTISWWTNVRFEQVFTPDLCRLLAASGCIAVTGGLEAASDRLLELMQKGVTVRQAAQACANFSGAGIMVHAYLMYGFPTQTAQETVDALEIVRQFFHEGLIQSAYWHRFTATVHSDVGAHPEHYGCRIVERPAGTFALNDLSHEDPSGCEHDAYAPGLRKAVYNFMYGIGMEYRISEWFDLKVPPVSVKKNAVEQAVSEALVPDRDRVSSRVLWLGGLPERITSGRTGRTGKGAKAGLVFVEKDGAFTLSPDPVTVQWLEALLPRLTADNATLLTFAEMQQDYEKHVHKDFSAFLRSAAWRTLREQGMLLI